MSEIDKYGCDRCFETRELFPCEKCDALVCYECWAKHAREEHLYPINQWRKDQTVSAGSRQ